MQGVGDSTVRLYRIYKSIQQNSSFFAVFLCDLARFDAGLPMSGVISFVNVVEKKCVCVVNEIRRVINHLEHEPTCLPNRHAVGVKDLWAIGRNSYTPELLTHTQQIPKEKEA
jgi:hypothetical protein